MITKLDNGLVGRERGWPKAYKKARTRILYASCRQRKTCIKCKAWPLLTKTSKHPTKSCKTILWPFCVVSLGQRERERSESSSKKERKKKERKKET